MNVANKDKNEQGASLTPFPKHFFKVFLRARIGKKCISCSGPAEQWTKAPLQPSVLLLPRRGE